ncbi:PAS domain S-box protein [Flavicella marina]|uniref:PAS domain S-box protein n=1 Tax=Flavicella marina TaxID=1475951 RepID=UPI001264A737|nr:PAS domain S-box protein [Flavicella marina]
MDDEKIKILERALKREKQARKQAELILEKKSLELYTIAQELKIANEKLGTLLNEKDTQLKGVFENINDAYLIMDLGGNVLKMNDSAVDFFEYDIQKEKLNVQNLIYIEDTEYAFNSFGVLLKEGHFSDYTARIITKSKKIKWVHINASIIFDDKNKPIAAQGIVRDITETKFNNELIEEQKNQLNAIVENAPFGIALTQQGSFIKTNKAFIDLIGYNENELHTISINDITHPEDVDKSKNLKKSLEKSDLNNFLVHKKYIKKDGSVIWAKTNVSAVRNTNRSLKYEVAIIEDITSEREKNLILDTIQKLTRSILGKVNIYEISWEIISQIANFLETDECSLYLVNKETNSLDQITTINPNTTDPKKIDIRSAELVDITNNGLSKIFDNKASKSVYGSEAFIPILNENIVIGIIHCKHRQNNFFNKSNINTLENIASLVAIQLKSAIHLRARNKAEKENITLLKQLEKNNLELQEYAHIVSHDLKSPLRSINALVSWIREDNQDILDNVSLSNMDLIDTTLEKMEQLISDILIYSSIGNKETKKENVNLNLLIEELKQIMFVPTNIQINILNELPTLNADRIKLQQLFQNLISNAIKFNDKKEGIIDISLIEEKKNYTISVRDNGIGIDEKYFKQIFKIFNSLKESKESSGIGLSIVKKIVDLLGGEVWIESEMNVFTAFFIKIPK